MRTLLVVAVGILCLGQSVTSQTGTSQSRAYTKCTACEAYTATNTGCPCWFDWSTGSKSCACCKNGGYQCGYPMHNYCWPRSKFTFRRKDKGPLGMGCYDRRGRIGVASLLTTISNTGHPCPWNTTDTSCPFCSVGNWICPKELNLDGSGGTTHRTGKLWGKGPYNICVSEAAAKNDFRAGRHFQYCKPTDCSIWPESCSIDATCKEVEYLPGKKTHVCVCRTGFIGNGITCVSQVSGTITKPPKGSPVGFNLKVTTELFLGPNGDNVTALSESQFSAVEEFLSSGKGNDTLEGSQCQLVGLSAESRSFPALSRTEL